MASEGAVAFKGPFHTERGAKEAVRILRKATDTTKVTQATFYDTSVLTVSALADGPKRYARVTYRP